MVVIWTGSTYPKKCRPRLDSLTMKKKLNFRRLDDAPRDDRGFTLIEMLITMIVGPIVIGGLVMMMLLIFNTQTGVSNKISGSVDAQVTTTNLQTDVQDATSVTTATTPSCGSNGTQILGTETQGNTVVVSYDVVASGKKYDLMRYSCSSSNLTSPVSQTLLSNDIPSNQTISVSCSVTCTLPSSWVPAANVSAVSLNVVEPTTKVAFSLISTPRAWTPAVSQSGGSPIPDITLLGTNTNNCSTSALTLGGNWGSSTAMATRKSPGDPPAPRRPFRVPRRGTGSLRPTRVGTTSGVVARDPVMPPAMTRWAT